MKLTVDTNRDSDDEIRTAIQVLQQLIDENPSEDTETVEDEPTVDEGSFDMFDDDVVTY